MLRRCVNRVEGQVFGDRCLLLVRRRYSGDQSALGGGLERTSSCGNRLHTAKGWNYCWLSVLIFWYRRPLLLNIGNLLGYFRRRCPVTL
ncbi:hypothetical protein L3X38_001674 [Prunus dulcis]|uniref:Uncharacterized protein n=1 Tax=Prunus dulcis TaxID=3755 RepID=A0AAD4ZJ87_PRUDU|nr:hypothetical protein L3X38_001674 [Prunus dulcis]